MQFPEIHNLSKVSRKERDNQNSVIYIIVVKSLSPNSLLPHELKHARLPCPSLSLAVCSNSSMESVTPSNHLILGHSLLLLPSFFPSIRVFSNELESLHQVAKSIGASASASVLPMNIQGWFPLGWTGLISLPSKGLSRVFSNTAAQKHQFFAIQPSLWSNSHNGTRLLEKP